MQYKFKEILPQFVKDYLATAAWSTSESNTECQEFTKSAQKEAELHCAMFMGAVIVEFGVGRALEILTIPGSDLGYIAAHDFWLTRQGHGTGFWDRERVYGEVDAEKLTEICKKLGPVDAYHVAGPKSKFSF